MAITCTEEPGRQTEWSIDDDGLITFTAMRPFVITSTTRLNGFEDIEGFPAPLSSYPTVSRAHLTKATASEDAELDGGSWVWHAKAHYTTRHFKAASEQFNELTDDPLTKPVVYRWAPTKITTTPNEDLDGKKFVNSAEDLLVDPPVITVSGSAITATKNFSTFSASYALDLIGKCNITPWLGRPMGTVIIDDVSPEEVTNGETTYVAVSITVLYNPLGWDPVKTPDMGPRYIDNATAQKVYPTDANDVTTTEPVLLNGSGFQLEEGDEPILLEFRMADYIDFNSVLGS